MDGVQQIRAALGFNFNENHFISLLVLVYYRGTRISPSAGPSHAVMSIAPCIPNPNFNPIPVPIERKISNPKRLDLLWIMQRRHQTKAKR